MPNGNENLKIKTVLGNEAEEIIFSPEEMQPFEVAEALESDLLYGKTAKQVKKAKKLFGQNEIRGEFRLSFRESMKNQIKGLTSLFLAVSSLIMYLFRQDEITYLVMAITIGVIAFLNAFAEFRASIALRVPKKYSSLKARVIRDGNEISIDSRQLVPGDLIMVEEGMMVPADCRLIDDMDLSVLESHIGGQEISVLKNSGYTAYDDSEIICENMIYAGSIVTSGHGSAIVCRTGANTLLRRIRSGKDDYTPNIIKYIKKLSSSVSIASLISCFSLLFFGIFAGADITNWFICSLAIGCSSLCDSMVSLCASSLGVGVKQMAEDGMVIKNYNCINTLAKTTTIMCGKNLAFPPQKISLTEVYHSGKSFKNKDKPDESAEDLLRLMLVCSDVKKIPSAERKKKKGALAYGGTPLDNAIVEYLGQWDISHDQQNDYFIRLEAEYTQAGDISRMLTLHNGKNAIIVRGSPENILSRCVGYTLDGKDYKISDFTRKKILSALEDSSRTNNFLVGIALGETNATELDDIEIEKQLIFKGFVAFSSSLAPGVAEAVYRCENAGIETVLNSNEAYYAAYHSAKRAGIISDESQIIKGSDMRQLDNGLFIANCPNYKLFLDVTDHEWKKIVKIRKDDKKITAVTAERINELPLMNEANVSIVPESSCDTLRQTADAMLLGSGINLIADGILNAKTICRRISSVISYLPVALIIMLTASIFTVCYNQMPPFRAQDVLFGGIIFNLAFAFALAFEPRSVKNLKDTAFIHRTKPSLTDFMYPLMYAIGGGIVMFVCSVATQCYTSTLIALSVMLFLYACSVGGHGGFFATKRFGNRLLYLCGLGAGLILLILMFTGLGLKFGYYLPEPTKVSTALILSASYGIGTQILRFFMHTDGKKKKQYSKTQPQGNQTDDIDYGDYYDEDFEEENQVEYNQQQMFDFEEENEKENNTNERSNQDDEDNC